jgi:hypothetical protein
MTTEWDDFFATEPTPTPKPSLKLPKTWLEFKKGKKPLRGPVEPLQFAVEPPAPTMKVDGEKDFLTYVNRDGKEVRFGATTRSHKFVRRVMFKRWEQWTDEMEAAYVSAGMPLTKEEI